MQFNNRFFSTTINIKILLDTQYSVFNIFSVSVIHIECLNTLKPCPKIHYIKSVFNVYQVVIFGCFLLHYYMILIIIYLIIHCINLFKFHI